MRRFWIACAFVVGAPGCGQSGDGDIGAIEGFVCGADGQTYTVEKAADGDHEVVHRGTCDEPMHCDTPADCFAGDECRPYDEADVCVPVANDCSCVGVFEPVCGADGRTYINECEARCVQVEVVFQGMCAPVDGCEDLACEPDEICVQWPQGEPPYCVWVGCDNDEQCRPGEHCVIDDICRAPAAVGPCDAAFPRWFHNFETGRCEEFTWGGCGGNDNNFETRDECEAACPSEVPKLSIAPRAGHCELEVHCTDISIPVCGIDGVTYGNPCEAERAGVDIAYDGECVAEITCRDRGCPVGWTCDYCEASDGNARWICLSPLAGACLPPS